MIEEHSSSTSLRKNERPTDNNILMKPALLIAFFASFAVLSCKNECYNCTLDGNVETVCSRHYSKKADFNAQLDSAAKYQWTCVKE